MDKQRESLFTALEARVSKRLGWKIHRVLSLALVGVIVPIVSLTFTAALLLLVLATLKVFGVMA